MPGARVVVFGMTCRFTCRDAAVWGLLSCYGDWTCISIEDRHMMSQKDNQRTIVGVGVDY